jgi:uncharacterized lipoprotein
MRKLTACLLFLTFINVVFIQAEFKFEVTKEMKKKEAEITITGKTFDEVWKATTRTLMSLEFQVRGSDKDSGTIFAHKRPGQFYEEGDALSTWNVKIESDEKQVIVFCVYNPGSDNPLSAGKRSFEKFHKKLKDVLGG